MKIHQIPNGIFTVIMGHKLLSIGKLCDKINSKINDRLGIVSSGSVFDITDTGIYYLTGAVTDKPTLSGSTRGGLIVINWNSTNQRYVQYVFFQGIANGEVWKCLTYKIGNDITNYGWEKLYPLS